MLKITRKQWVLAGLVGLLIVDQISILLLRSYEMSFGNLVDLLSILLLIAVYLKLMLPFPALSHRKWLGILLGVSLVSRLSFSVSWRVEAFPLLAIDYAANDLLFAQAGFLAASLWALITLTVLSAYFWLLINILRKKTKHKIAIIMAFISFVLFVLDISAAALTPLIDPNFQMPQLIWMIIPTAQALIFAIVLLKHPVLRYPILSKENTYHMQISLKKTTEPKSKPDTSNLGFGNYFTDHMFLMNYKDGKGWHNPRIVPYAPFQLDPAAMCLHYGQEVFEGMKAYYGTDKKVRLFRPLENIRRLNASSDRLCIPPLDEDFTLHAIEELVQLDRDWIPTADGTSLYIRPFIIAADPFLGVRPASEYIFAVILSPVGAYYPEGLAPVKIFVERDHVRAVRGGTGAAKAGGNYAATLKAQQMAKASGCAQVMWLDGIERKYIEEVGTSNAFFVIGDEVITPALSGSILPGITRKSCIELLRANGHTVVERAITLDEVLAAARSGNLKEAFATGTAAVISPMGTLLCDDEEIIINRNETGDIAQWLYNELTGIQWGRVKDNFEWTKVI